MKQIFWCLITILVLISNLSAEKYESKIESAVKRILLPDHRQQELAKKELAKLPADADQDLILVFERSMPAVKIAMIEIFALRKQKNSIDAIISAIEFLPEESASRVASALGQISDDAWRLLADKIEKNNARGKQRSPKLEKIYKLLVRENIIIFFKDLCKKRRYFYDPVATQKIYKYGSIAVEFIGELIFNENNMLGNFPIDKSLNIRESCVRSLGDCGFSKAITVLKKALQFFRDDYDSWNSNEENVDVSIRTRCALSLYNLGDTLEAETIFDKTNRKIEENDNNKQKIIVMQKLVKMLLQIHKYKEAEEQANKIIDLIANLGAGKEWMSEITKTYYIIATINGIRAVNELDKDKKQTYRRRTMQSLKQAVRYGFNDFELIYLDNNVSIVWNSGEFAKWIAKLKIDPKIKEKIPDWKPGNPPTIEEEKKKKKDNAKDKTENAE